MRILAIRGKNLASLANEFEVQLEQGVLQQVGLFAITGATGSGKSTILDALCLALYDKMPRLPDGQSVAIGHKDEDDTVRVKSNDVSSILRRGTASAYAEVDFIGKDKHSYRARWEISRARNNVNGRLQAQKISLENLHSQEKIGQGKKDTQQEIITRIGLNFDQFRRSVLLAQGDFAAFLKAKKDERSSLLEKITGTDIYSELSVAAFERAKAETQRLQRIQEKLADKVPLDPEARKQLEAEHSQLNTQSSDIQQALKEQQVLVDWFQRQAILEQASKEAQQAVQQAQAQWAEQASARELLEQVEQVQALRPLLEQEQQLSKDVLAAEAAIDEHQRALLKAQQVAEEAGTTVASAGQILATAQQQHTEAQPLLITARKLDTQLEERQRRLARLEQEHEAQALSWQSAQTLSEQLSEQQTQMQATLQGLHIWQEQQAALAPLVDEWGRWQSAIKDTIALDQSLRQKATDCVALEQDIARQQSELTGLQSQNAAILAEKQQLNDALMAATKQADEYALTDLLQQKSSLEVQRENIDQAVNLATLGEAQQASLVQDQAAISAAEQAGQQARILIEQLTLKQSDKHVQLDEAQQALSLVKAANQKTAQGLRALLTEHAPCPVCGAEEHPWADLQVSLQQPVAEQQARVKSLQGEKEQLITQLSEQNSALKQAKKDQLRLQQNMTKTEQESAQLQQQWHLIELDHKPEWTRLQAADIRNFKQHSEHLNAQYAKAKQQEQLALAVQQQVTELREQSDQLSHKEGAQSAKMAELDKKIAEQGSTLLAGQADLVRLETELKARMASLHKPFEHFDNWQEQLLQAGDAFLAPLAEAIEQWQKNTEQQDAVQAALLQIQNELVVATADAQQKQSLWEKCQQQQRQEDEQYQTLLSERQGYFKGAAANDHAHGLEQGLASANAAKQQADAALVAANIALESRHSALAHWQEEQHRRLLNKQVAEQKLLAALQAQQLSRAMLETLLDKDESWITAQTQKKQLLTTALQEAQASLTVKNDALREHGQQSPEVPETWVHERMQKLRVEQDSVSEQYGNIVFALRADDEKIIAGQDLQQQLAQQQQRWEQWESLNELIGSKSGQKFRVFAQSLTLETLLAYTNRHLQEFAKRYYLQRVPGSDLELQVVDKDMADEVRSVHSLSGGESFLVSLALALGLASLSSNKTQVESLFIDEGFGSLDSETLDIAIASLDTLQSLGRKVGVISHVPVLVERIGAQVLVEKQGGGQSVVSVRAYA